MRAAAATARAARSQLIDELPTSCFGPLLALLLAQARACCNHGLSQMHFCIMWTPLTERGRMLGQWERVSGCASALKELQSAAARNTAQRLSAEQAAAAETAREATEAAEAAQVGLPPFALLQICGSKRDQHGSLQASSVSCAQAESADEEAHGGEAGDGEQAHEGEE